MDKWLVTKDGETKCYGTSEKTFPRDDLIATLRAAGYKIFVDGKPYTKKKGGAIK